MPFSAEDDQHSVKFGVSLTSVWAIKYSRKELFLPVWIDSVRQMLDVKDSSDLTRQDIELEIAGCPKFPF